MTLVRGCWGIEPERSCAYLPVETARFESMWLDELDDAAFNQLVLQGYRHFGRHFFRPYCPTCHRCLPIRIPVSQWRETRSVRKAFKRARHLSMLVKRPCFSPAAFDLYRSHKTRFEFTSSNEAQLSHESFEAAFFHPFPFAYMLEIRDGDRLLAVSHFDRTDDAMSAVYCYFNPDASHLSLGRLAIYQELRLAAEYGIPHLYLGYYIQANKHMSYKALYRPNEILLSGPDWVPFMASDGDCMQPEGVSEAGFRSCGRPFLE